MQEHAVESVGQAVRQVLLDAGRLAHQFLHIAIAGAGLERAELVGLVEQYRKGLLPLVVPLTLLRHHVRRQGETYLQGQVYLEPHPRELMLLNHV